MNPVLIDEAKHLYIEALRTHDFQGVYQHDYLNSGHWQTLKLEMIRARPKKCELCGNEKDVTLRHLQYKNWYDVSLEDLAWLCEKHHALIHQARNLGFIKNNGNSDFLVRDTMRYVFALETEALEKGIQTIHTRLSTAKDENAKLHEYVAKARVAIAQNAQNERKQQILHKAQPRRIPVWLTILLSVWCLISGIAIGDFSEPIPDTQQPENISNSVQPTLD